MKKRREERERERKREKERERERKREKERERRERRKRKREIKGERLDGMECENKFVNRYELINIFFLCESGLS